MSLLTIPLLILILLSQSYIDLEVVLPGGALNAPVADWAALVLLPLAAAGWLRGERTPLPGLAGYTLMLMAAVLSVRVAIAPAESFHHLLRKPLFFYLAYGFGLAWLVRRVQPRVLWGTLIVWTVSTAGLSVLTSVSRILAGDALWFASIGGLTPNHKTLAVGLSTALPLLIVHMITLLLRVALLTRRLVAHLEGPSLPAPAATAVFLWRHVQ